MSEQTNETEVLVKAMAAINGIDVNDEIMPMTKMHFEIASKMAKALIDFPLDEREEPAQGFTP
jgi:hypothetical protein